MTRLLLGQLSANGDCLYATILARQIRRDYPDAHLTWAISSLCSGVLRNNPDVDEIWEVPVTAWHDQELMWRVFEREAVRRLLRHEFDHAWLSQIWPNNFQNFDGTVRPSILRSYGAPLTVPIENVIVLDDGEKARVDEFARAAGLDGFAHRILFECSSKSGQSFMTPDLAQAVAEHVYASLPSACIVFCTNLPMQLRHANSRYAGTLSLREVGGLTHHGTFFVGCGSGNTVAASSLAARRLPMIQVLSASTSMFASFAHDFEYFGLPKDHIAEITVEAPAAIAAAIVTGCSEGVAATRARFARSLTLHFEHYFELIRAFLLKRERYIDASQSLATTAERYGWVPELREFGRREIEPQLRFDPGWIYPYRRQAADVFRAKLAAAGAARS